MEYLATLIGPENLDMFTRVFVAMVLGMILGIERVFAHKTAGMRTYSLVAIGAALFTVISVQVSETFVDISNFDPLRVASQVVVGLGFIGAGIIIFKGTKISGLTTATGLWVAGAIGVASGFSLYALAVFSTLLVLITFTFMWFIEKQVKKFSGLWGDDEI